MKRTESNPGLAFIIASISRITSFCRRRSVQRRAHRVASFLVIVSMLASFFGGSPASSHAVQPDGLKDSVATTRSSLLIQEEPEPPAPPQRTVTPIVDPHLPGLNIELDVSPYQVAVGDLFTVTVRVNNVASDPASNLSVNMPLPEGVVRDEGGGPSPSITSQTTPPTTPQFTPQTTPQTTPQAPQGYTSNQRSAPNASQGSATGTFATGTSGTTTTAIPSGTATLATTASTTTSTTESATASSSPSSSSTTPTTTPTPDPNSWTWQQASLPANSSTSFVATMRLAQTPLSGAILTTVQASADGLSTPATSTTGAIFVQRGLGNATVPFTPGQPTVLHSLDGRVQVDFPGNAYTGTLTLQHSTQPGSGNQAAPDATGRKNGLGSFYLNATDAQNNQVHQFSAPLTITVTYTPEQLEALGISEQDATLFWYDENHEGGAQWVPTSTQIDDVNHTAITVVSHFTGFTLSDGSSPSAAFVPSLQGWQVGLYTGDVSYQFPIDVPAGPGGIKPNLSLTYDSTSTDGDTGTRQKQQASWAGKGWSLDTGYVALNRLPAESDVSRYYTLVFNGQSFDLVRGEHRTGRGTSLSDPTNWEWHPTDENFIRARAEVQSSQSGRGGPGYQRYMWKVWAKDGTRYDFMEDAWQAFVDCSAPDAFLETYKWYLSRVVDSNRNVVTYNYDRLSETIGQQCTGVTISGTTDYSVWPTSITWGYNSGVTTTPTPVDRYKVEFVSSARGTVDMDYDRSLNHINRAPMETRVLDRIDVYSKQSSTWDLVRRYQFNHETNNASRLLSDYSDGSNNPDTTHTKVTLNSITRVGNDGTTALPDISFTYGHSRGTGYYPTADWNRLTGVDNGQGGTISFLYENIGSVIGNGLFRNYRRVYRKTVTDGQGHSYEWNYAYSNPALNSLGTSLNAGDGPNVYPNSATVYYNDYYNGSYNTSKENQLVHGRKKEFRGHSYVTETDPNGNLTEHWFYQGDYGCTPASVGDSCYNNMKLREFLAGREYHTITRQGGQAGDKLSETTHAFTVNFIADGSDSYGDDRLTGLWRAFSYENQTVDKAWDSSATALSKTTNYEYTDSYGNLTAEEERDTNNVLLRRIEHSYGQNDSADGYWYIVDRKRSDNVFDSGHNWLARTVYAYDGSYGDGTISNGNLTLVRKYYNLTSPPAPSLPNPVSSSDTSFGYDDYGNRTSQTTYTLPGEQTAGPTWTAPGCSAASGCGTARTTTTTYDTVFHALPTRIDPPTAGGVTLTQQAGYDYRMGLITSVTDPNNITTSQEYDVFGRWTRLIKDGDTSAIPTSRVWYYDYEQPVRYLVVRQNNSGVNGDWRTFQYYYDGIGNQIQTKNQSLNSCAQSIVTDKVYDAFGQVIQESLPRYVDTPNGCASPYPFYNYVTPGSPSVEHWTTTLYDGLGRATRVTAPDNTYSTMAYSVDLVSGAYVRTTTTIDAKLHKTKHMSDAFGRLVRVQEFSGNGTPPPMEKAIMPSTRIPFTTTTPSTCLSVCT